jgi:hypothetical protein
VYIDDEKWQTIKDEIADVKKRIRTVADQWK